MSNQKKNNIEKSFIENKHLIDMGSIANFKKENSNLSRSRKSSQNEFSNVLDLNENNELSMNSNISQSTCVKNYIIKYRGLNFDEIEENLKVQLEKNPFDIKKKIINDPVITLQVSFVKQKRFNKDSPELTIKGVKPFYCLSAVASKKKNIYTFSNDILDKAKPDSIYKVTWNYNRKNLKIFQGNSINDNNKINPYFANDEKEITYKLEFEFNKLFEDLENFDGNKFTQLLAIKIVNCQIKNKNEIILSHIVYSLIENLNKDKENKIKIYGIDYKFKEIILDYTTNFRVDMILKYNCLLYVVEFKFREDRISQGINAQNCIKFKAYSERTLNHIEEKHPEEFNEIKSVVELGIGFSNVEENIAADIYGVITLKEDFNRNLYKSDEFVTYMRRNIKRFTKYLD